MSTAVEEHVNSTGVDNKKLMMWIFLGSDCLFFGSFEGKTALRQKPSLLIYIVTPTFSFFNKSLVASSFAFNTTVELAIFVRKISVNYLA